MTIVPPGRYGSPVGELVMPDGGPWTITHVGWFGDSDWCGSTRKRGDAWYACPRRRGHPGRHYRNARVLWRIA